MFPRPAGEVPDSFPIRSLLLKCHLQVIPSFQGIKEWPMPLRIGLAGVRCAFAVLGLASRKTQGTADLLDWNWYVSPIGDVFTGFMLILIPSQDH